MKIQPWFNEWEETFEFVKCQPTLGLMPMEVHDISFDVTQRTVY